jgi:hypothetical protein
MTEAIEKNEAVEQEAASENKKPYTFRKLSSDDVFLMFAILGKIGVKELKHAFSGDALELLIQSFKQSGESDNAKVLTAVGVNVGFDAVDMILNNLPKCKEEIYQMLSNCSGLDVDTIRADALLFAEMVTDFVKKEEFPAFIKVVSKLFK